MATVYFISDVHLEHKNLSERFRGMSIEDGDIEFKENKYEIN